MGKRIKIVATIGPATADPEVVRDLLQSGVDLCRFNWKHNSTEWHQKSIELVRETAETLGKHVGIIVDIPNLEKAKVASQMADYVALSYLKTAEDVEALRQLIGNNKRIIAKIENQSALKNLDKILAVANAVMVARGDLGIEVPMEQLAYWQKLIVDWSRIDNKPVIVATQMLQSMVNSPTPTRAEATDVSNAVFDGTDALMLSEETAIGKYPVAAVREMVKIANFNDNLNLTKPVIKPIKEVADALVASVEMMAKNQSKVKYQAVVVFTQSGETARKLAGFRMKLPIVAVTDNREILEALSLSYGVIPYFQAFSENSFQIEAPIFASLVKEGILSPGGQVILVHGNNWYGQGQTTDISLKQV